jgi:hypothetical protein
MTTDTNAAVTLRDDAAFKEAATIFFDNVPDGNNSSETWSAIHAALWPAIASYIKHTATVAAIQPAGDADELHYNAQRLRNVGKLCGLDFGCDDKQVDECRGALLGSIASVLRNRAAAPAVPSQPEASAEPITNWYESMRRTLIGQVHELIDIAERSTWRKDDEDEVKRTEGAIAHARKVSSVYNYNGDGTTQRTQILATSSAAKGATP